MRRLGGMRRSGRMRMSEGTHTSGGYGGQILAARVTKRVWPTTRWARCAERLLGRHYKITDLKTGKSHMERRR